MVHLAPRSSSHTGRTRLHLKPFERNHDCCVNISVSRRTSRHTIPSISDHEIAVKTKQQGQARVEEWQEEVVEEANWQARPDREEAQKPTCRGEVAESRFIRRRAECIPDAPVSLIPTSCPPHGAAFGSRIAYTSCAAGCYSWPICDRNSVYAVQKVEAARLQAKISTGQGRKGSK